MSDISEKPIRSLCVYCGSSPGNDSQFIDAARALGRDLAEQGIRLVYGGGDKGLMGAVAESALAHGGAVLGIIPEFLLKSEQIHQAKNIEGVDMQVVPDMHTRKRQMFEESDAFLAMPGGIGTLEELVEVLTWAQLRRHSKPVGLLNINDFWSPYVELVQHMAEAGFLHNPDAAMPQVFASADDVVGGLFPSTG
ncbi:MAG: TIGR00730 family Rossman fold protein [Rhizobiaceae bacterium]|nr:TIGR00730 family Rossman fold protein [Hyphomicrobiales bacterium]NRB31326.1 TIGR00730 family Rossman fold protein [Rhizobiaceae bacterium]